MEYPLMPSQRVFYPKGLPMEEIMWNCGMALLFRKQYTAEQFCAALHGALAAFEELRLRFSERDGEVFAQVTEVMPQEFPRLHVKSRQELMVALQALLDEPFDMAGPLFRGKIFDSPEGSGIFFCAHHIIFDGFSVQTVARYIYDYLENCEESGNPLSYAEHFSLEQKYRDSKRYLRDQQYWTEKLAAPTGQIFPADRNSVHYEARELVLEPDPEWMERIRQFCKAEGITPAAFFSTVLGIWLRREYDCSPVRLGLSVMNRTNLAELHSAGLFMRILPLTVSLEEDSFAACARCTEEQKMDLFRHQKMTSWDLNAIQKAQNAGRGTLFEVVFDYQEFQEFSGMEIAFSYSSALSVPLEIHLMDYGQRQKLHIRYRTALFSGEQMLDLFQRIEGISAAAVACPQLSPAQLPQYRLTKETCRLLEDWNSTQHTYNMPQDSTLYSLFAEYAAAHPTDVCLHAGSRSLTFQELRSRAETLDSAIRQITGQQKSVIALIAERSAELYTAVYAIIRGGNAYLPIDPGYPPERIKSILKNSGAAAVLAQAPFAKLGGALPCIDLTQFFDGSSSGYPVFPAAALPEDTAYVIYTSGSTGEPKGAMISHRSAVNRILWMQEKYPLDDGSVILQKTPITFDVSVWELFWWGMCGGQLVASAPGEHFLPAKILQAVVSRRVTHLHFVPSVFDLFLTYLEEDPYRQRQFASVRHVFLSGETLPASLIRRFYAMFPYPRIRLHNLYGPTECAVDVTYYDCTPEDTDPVPIGRPIFNTSIYILDPAMNLLPPGKLGELCIGGMNVGQGYRNAEALTAERFVKNPFGPGKLYKTGDYAAFRPDGQILFHGRMDGQIKLHGQRIETGEIEAVIGRVPGVETTVVLPCGPDAKSRLVAFYCGTPELHSNIDKICRRALPAYMVPGQIVHLEKFPLNGSGKLDRRALQDLLPRISEEPACQPPRTPEEERVCDAFSRVLNCGPVGRDSNFFDLGGSSLDMITLLSLDEFEGISPGEFMSNPTAEALAQQICVSDAEAGWVQPLRQEGKPRKALILFPYAGGEAGSFAAFVHCATKLAPELGLYCVKYPHSEADCQSIASELEKMAENTALFFYSHCAGAAPALRVLNLLEQQNPGAAGHYFAAAAIPPAAPPGENLWHSVSDELLRSILEGAGASFRGLSGEQIAELFGRFRRDTDFYTAYFQTPAAPVYTPVTLFLSREDPFTENYSEAGYLWEKYAANLESIHFIESRSHYFQAEQPEILLREICRVIGK